MIENDQIKQIISDGLPQAEVQVQGDGYHYQIQVVCESFQELSKLRRQQKIYQLLGDKVKSGELHALTIHAFTPSEWETKTNG